MTIALTFAVLGVFALALIVQIAKGHLSTGGDLDELAAQLRPLDVTAFCNLMSESEQQFLRNSLPATEFRAVHRERMLAAADYIRCAARNAAILIRLAESARQHSDPAIAAAAEKLLDSGIRLRLYALQILPRILLSAVFPQVRMGGYDIAEIYDTMSRQVTMLSCLRFPTHGMSSAL